MINTPKFKLLAIFLSGVALLCTGATPGPFITDGNSLQEHIRSWRRSNAGGKVSADERLIAALTVAYFTGFIEGLSVWQAYDRERCPYAMPKGMQSRQFIEVAGKYLAEHPEELHRPAADILKHAAVAAFPNPDFKPQSLSGEDRKENQK